MLVMTSSLLAYSQMLMKVEKSDGTIVEYLTTDVKRVFFESLDPPTPTTPIPEIVDLGLSVKWASFNVGASKPEESGGYYSWGETEEKDSYTAETYLYNNIYLGPCISGSPLDVANVKLGYNWRLPTSDEFYELYSQCTWTWTSVGGIPGFQITGPNGNYIFLPSAGFYRIDQLRNTDGEGCYSSGSAVGMTEMSYLRFETNRRMGSNSSSGRNGYTVRAVYDDSNASATVSVSTLSAEVSSDCTATLVGEVTGVGIGVSVGFIMGGDASISVDNGEVQYLRAKDTFKTKYSGLENNTTYYYRAFAYVNGNFIYGDVKSFTTQSQPTAAPEAVDLGLSVKWASFNVGASKPEEYGSYYTSSSVVEEVRAIWGSGWRLPTQAEAEELVNNCSRIWQPRNGVNGLELKATNGNSIFLPAAGSLHGTLPQYDGEDGNYKTSGSRYLYFCVPEHKVAYEDDSAICSIRLVYDGGDDGGDDTPDTPVEESLCPDENHPHIIDLGIGTLWACCNVGANKPEEYGGYYAWGETKEKSEYTPNTYLYYTTNEISTSSWTYNGTRYYCVRIGNDISGSQYDTARVNWGSPWRMPKESEINDLIQLCSRNKTTVNGIDGVKFTGPNGNSVFLPSASGASWDDSYGRFGGGWYWLGVLSNRYEWDAKLLNFSTGSVYLNNYGYYRHCGFSVRPVQ